MKKIFLIVIMLLNIGLCLQHGRLTVRPVQTVSAQRCPNNVSGPGTSGNGSSGGGIFGFLSNAFNTIKDAIVNVANAIADFFSGADGDGESIGEEDDGEDPSWFPTGDGDFIPPDPYTDPWSDPAFESGTWGSEEWEIANNWVYYYQLYTEANTRPEPNPKYYITVAGTYYRYYNNDTIAIPQSDSTVLTLHNENPNYTVGCQGTSWKENDTIRTMEMKTCWIMTRRDRVSALKVHDDVVDTSLIKNPLVVYKTPLIIFEHRDNWAGEYGFDDSSHKHAVISGNPTYARGAETTTIAGTSYVVPWMSLLDGKSGVVKLKKIMDKKINKDKAFGVYLTPSSPSITINGQASLNLRYAELDTMNTITIAATEWDPTAEANKVIGTIYATTWSGDTIGKLNISCAKPALKNVMFVYVNTGNGYANKVTGPFSKQAILDQLNDHSHNQIMRQWVLDASKNYLDTLDCTAEFLADSSKFTDPDSASKWIRRYFYAHKGLVYTDLNPGIGPGTNNPAKLHISFIFTYRCHPDSNTHAITDLGGYVSLFFNNSVKETFTHEFGHHLNLDHTFEAPYNIPKFSTRNFMDYDYYIPPPFRNMFYFSQWTHVY